MRAVGAVCTAVNIPAFQITSPVKDGRLPQQISKRIAQVIKGFDGGLITLTISKAKKKRSDRQNAFYFGCVLPLVVQMFREAGSDATPDEIHVFLKGKVGGLTRLVQLPDGSMQEVVVSSTTQGTSEWETWMEKIRMWAAENGGYLPMPNEI